MNNKYFEIILKKPFILALIAFFIILISIPKLAFSYNNQRFVKIFDMNFSRSHHSAVLMQDGRVFITGGTKSESAKTAEIFDPKTNKFTKTNDMNLGKQKPYLLTLKDGRIFIFGKNIDTDYRSCTSSAEIYDPKIDKYEILSGFENCRTEYSSVSLDNGNIIIPGSFDHKTPAYLKSIIFNPDTNKITPINLPPLDNYKVTKLKDTNIFILGRFKIRDNDFKNLFLIYNPINNTYKELNVKVNPNINPRVPKFDPLELISLRDGKVLIFVKQNSWNNGLLAILNPSNNSIKHTESRNPAFYYSGGFAITKLKNDQILLTGGGDNYYSSQTNKKAGIYDPKYKTYDEIKNIHFEVRPNENGAGAWNREAIQIPGNQHIIHKTFTEIFGNLVYQNGNWVKGKAEEPPYNTYELMPDMLSKRSGHTATLLQNGNVLITGGNNGKENLNSAELFKVQ